jgi:hypothetical protein
MFIVVLVEVVNIVVL